MANDYIKHSFTSPKSDGPDSTLIRPSNWNDGLVYTGGVTGQILVCDNTADNNMKWVDGARHAFNLVNITNPTTSPANSINSIALSINTAAAIVIAVVATITTTGAAAGTITVNVPGLISASTFASGVQISPTYCFTANPGATVSVDISSVGNVNFTGGSIILSVFSIGRVA